MGEYTAAAIAAPVVVVLAELTVFRTGLLKRPRYWITIAIVLGFQVPVDGRLTDLGAPIVVYSPAAISGIRWPLDIPLEDFGFGYAMVTFTLLVWTTVTRRTEPARPVRADARSGGDGDRG